ncbi:unnamed protein product [Adineta steineri]|uniref:Uncharacterized protein n=1 Tax=Adineta steineri TaxID=433720 RepID=A0A815GW47_9BILA|nr:unnamed protein product [Adineta steineri]
MSVSVGGCEPATAARHGTGAGSHFRPVTLPDYRSKYSRAGSGRPVKRRINEAAQRDRFKQLMVIPYNDHIANNIEEKIYQLQDVSEIDAETRLKLWKETFSCRREYVRNQSTSDIVQKFPGYADSFLVFEEVKMLLQIDLAAAIRRQPSVILNKIVSSPVFITDSPVIQLIKTLCKEFGETIHHLFSTSVSSQEQSNKTDLIITT